MDAETMSAIPLICGLATIVFSWTIIYIDTDESGKTPQNSVSSQYDYEKHLQNYDHKLASQRIGFILSFSSGAVVFFLLQYVQWENKYLKIY